MNAIKSKIGKKRLSALRLNGKLGFFISLLDGEGIFELQKLHAPRLVAFDSPEWLKPFKFFSHRALKTTAGAPDDSWNVTEAITGYTVSKWCETRTKAISEARKRFKSVTAAQFLDRLKLAPTISIPREARP
jgi:hypothetical protein